MSIESTSPRGRAYARIKTFCDDWGVSRSGAYRLAADGHIRLVKLGGATLVDMDSVREHFAKLPAANIRTAA
jgi:hypothetical protein